MKFTQNVKCICFQVVKSIYSFNFTTQNLSIAPTIEDTEIYGEVIETSTNRAQLSEIEVKYF